MTSARSQIRRSCTHTQTTGALIPYYYKNLNANSRIELRSCNTLYEQKIKTSHIKMFEKYSFILPVSASPLSQHSSAPRQILSVCTFLLVVKGEWSVHPILQHCQKDLLSCLTQDAERTGIVLTLKTAKNKTKEHAAFNSWFGCKIGRRFIILRVLHQEGESEVESTHYLRISVQCPREKGWVAYCGQNNSLKLGNGIQL